MPRKPKSSPGLDDRKAIMGDWSKHAGFGIQYAVTIGIFAFGGFKLDEWLGTEPFGLLIAVFAGFIGATVSLVKKLPTSGPPVKSKTSTESNPEDKKNHS